MNDKQMADQIIARARQEIAMRQATEAAKAWSGMWQWLPAVLVVAALLSFLIAPTPLPDKLLWIMGGVCALRPAHSFFIGGVQLPMESRMVGIYGGFILTFIILLALRRHGARQLGSTSTIALLLLFFSSMVFDGINSTLAELVLPHPYESTNMTRLITGLLSGIAIAPLLMWLLGRIAVPPHTTQPRAVIGSPWVLALTLLANVLFAVLIISGRVGLYYPLALLSVGGVLGVLTIVTLLVILGMSGLDGRITRLRQLLPPSALALFVAFVVLTVTAAARWTLTSM